MSESLEEDIRLLGKFLDDYRSDERTQWTACEWVSLDRVLDLVGRIPTNRLDPFHRITIRPSSWTMTHPLDCDLGSCPYSGRMDHWQSWASNVAPGTYEWHGLNEYWIWIEPRT